MDIEEFQRGKFLLMISDRIKGSLLGLALGDAMGAPYEGGLIERALWSVIGKRKNKRRWTDDTQMTIDVTESLLACRGVNQDDLAMRFARSYQWSRGYGPGTAKLLKRITQGQDWKSANRSVYQDGSYGNGGAMRAPVVGLYYIAASEDEIIEAARATAEVTHRHPLACEGAALIALTTALACKDTPTTEIMERLCQLAESDAFIRKLQKAQT